MPIEPGYRKFVIESYAGDLDWVKGSVVTPYGVIDVSWQHKKMVKLI